MWWCTIPAVYDPHLPVFPGYLTGNPCNIVRPSSVPEGHSTLHSSWWGVGLQAAWHGTQAGYFYCFLICGKPEKSGRRPCEVSQVSTGQPCFQSLFLTLNSVFMLSYSKQCEWIGTKVMSLTLLHLSAACDLTPRKEAVKCTLLRQLNCYCVLPKQSSWCWNKQVSEPGKRQRLWVWAAVASYVGFEIVLHTNT